MSCNLTEVWPSGEVRALDSQAFISGSCINRILNHRAKALSPREFNIFLECSSKKKNVVPELDMVDVNMDKQSNSGAGHYKNGKFFLEHYTESYLVCSGGKSSSCPAGQRALWKVEQSLRRP